MSQGAGSEKSLFPNSLPVRQSLPSIHSRAHTANPSVVAAAASSSSSAAATSKTSPAAALSAGGTAGAKPGTGSPYSLGTATNDRRTSPHTSISPIPPYGASSPSRASPTLSGGGVNAGTSSSSSGGGGGGAPSAPGQPHTSPPPPPARTPLPGVSSLTSNHQKAASPPSFRANPMSVSSMLSGPPRERSIPAYSTSAGGVSSSVSAPAGGAPGLAGGHFHLSSAASPPALPVSAPQPPTLPSLSSSHTKAGSPPLSSSSSSYRASSTGGSGGGGHHSPAMSSTSAAVSVGGKAKSPELPSMSIPYPKLEGKRSPSISSATSPKLGASSSSAAKVERAYPPLPSAYARESPYSNSAWSNNSANPNASTVSRSDHGYVSNKERASASPSTLTSTSQSRQQPSSSSQDKTFFPGVHAFSRQPTNSNTGPNIPPSSTSSTSTHRHGSSNTTTMSYPPTFPPWSGAGSHQASQQSSSAAAASAAKSGAQQPSSQRPYPDYYSATVDHVREDGKRSKSSSNEHHYTSSSTGSNANASRTSTESYKPAPLGTTSNSSLSSSQSTNGENGHIRYPGADYPPLGRAATNGSHAPAPPVLPLATSVASTTTAGWAAVDPAPATLSAPSTEHKRRRSEGQSTRARPSDVVAKAKLAKPFVAPFSAIDLRKAYVRPPLVDVQSTTVHQAVAERRAVSMGMDANADGDVKSKAVALPRPFLGRVVYDPLINPAELIDGQMLRRNIGGTLQVVISTGYLAPCLTSAESTCRLEVGNPLEYDGHAVLGTHALETQALPTCIWDLDPVRKRCVWGTDVYTDDSDVVAMCLHSGWLRLADSKPPKAGDPTAGLDALLRAKTPLTSRTKAYACKKGRSIVVSLTVAPALIRYEGSPRQGLKSRSWGNGHDGVSLIVEDIEVVDSIAIPKGHRFVKQGVRETAIEFARSFAPKPHFTNDETTEEEKSVEASLSADVAHETFVLGFDVKSSRFLSDIGAEASSSVEPTTGERTPVEAMDTD